MAKNYQDGFILLSQLETSGLKHYPVTASTIIDIGDVCVLTSGYIITTATLLAYTFCGVANGDCTAAEATATKGTIDIPAIPPYQHYQFIVPCENTAVLDQADVGLCYDAEANHSITNTAVVTTYWGFFVDAIDISAEAIAAETYGYAIGHFVLMPEN